MDEKWFGTDSLYSLAKALVQTAKDNGAVGLAAQQCGIDARIVYLKSNNHHDDGILLINQEIIQRLSEMEMTV